MLKKVVYRSTVLATIIALSMATISATSAFAAGQSHRENSIRSTDLGLVSQWKAEVAAYKADRFILESSIGKWATEWRETKRSSIDMHKENRYAAQIAADIFQAEQLVAKHPGFNDQGKVTDRAIANQSIQNLALDLHRFHMELTDKIRALFA
ncbi:MAG: hypothetical protein ACM3XO_12950 [Bacteroidota bacterium]